MSTATIETVIKMLENLPINTQERAVEHLREYIEDLKDEAIWDNQFSQSSNKLEEMARKAKAEIAQGKATSMDFDKK